MIQVDSSTHLWFGRRKYTLLVFIDDATNRLLWLEFAKSESVESVMAATRKYFEKYGHPISFYVDFGSTFHVNLNNKDHEKFIQLERAMKELKIRVIHVNQATGIVECSNGALLSRLI